MFKKFSKLLLTLAMLLGVTSAWADVAVLSSPSASCSELTDAGGIITITDKSSGGGGIQVGSGSFTYGSSAYTPMKLSGSRQFELTYNSKVTINSVTILCTDNKNDGTEYHLGVSSSDRTSIGKLAVKGATPSEFDITDKTGLNADVQFNAIIIVDYTAAAATDPTISISSKSLDLSLTSYNSSKTEKVTLKGALLTDGTYSVSTSATGLSISPTSFDVKDGKADQEFEITYASESAVASSSETIEFKSADDDKVSVATEVTYGKVAQRGITEIASISDSYTWDFSKTGATAAIQLTDLTSPNKEDKFVLGNIAELKNSDDFKSDALEVQTEYAVRDGKYFQGGYVKFNTTVPGTIKVVFSNTGNRSNDDEIRYLYVNGEKTEFGSKVSNANVTTDEIEVPAGDVVLTAQMPKVPDTDQYIRIYSIEFKAKEPEKAAWKDVELVLCGDNSIIREITTERWGEINTGIAIDEKGAASIVTVDAENSVATLSGKYVDSQWGMSNPVLTIPVEGPVRISLGSSYYAGTVKISADGTELKTIESNVGENAHLWGPNDPTVVTYDYTGGAATLTIACTCYEPYIKVEAIEAPTPPTTDPDADYELKEKVVYSTKFQDWEKAAAVATNETQVTQTTTDGQELVFTLLDTAVDPEGTNSKFTNDCVTVGYLQTNKSANASITTSPLESITKLELVQAATGGTRGITVYVKGDGDEDWVELHNKSIAAAGGETLTFDVNRTNCQIKFGNFAANQNAYITSLKISGNVKVAKRTFQDFKVDFRIKSGEQAYTLVTPADGLPEGVTINAGTYNGGQHGATNPTISVKVDGPVKFTIGSCQFGSHTVTVKDETGATIATVDNNNGCENGYTAIENCTYNNYVVYTYNNEKPATLTFNVNGYCPFFIAEQCEYIPSVTVSYYGLDNKLVKEEVVDGGSDLKFACSEADLTIPDGMAFRGWFDGSSATAMKVQEGISLTTDTKLYAKATDIEVATVGSVWNYDLTKKNFYQEDHELIEMTGKYNNNHGWAFGAGQTIKLQVAGNAIVNFTLCQFGNEGTIVATDAAGNTFGETITTPVSADGNSASISYKGEATTLTFTLTNGGYVHGVKVFNVTEIPEKNEAGYYVVNPNDGASLLLILANVQAGDKIFLPNGTYDFGETTGTTIGVNNLSIIGESMEGTIIRNCPPISNEGLGKADLFYNVSTGLYMQDLTLQNDLDYYGSGAAGRAAVLQDNGNQTILRNVAMRSYQDTYYSKSGNYYFEGGLIQGTVDYICGGGNAWFEDITLLNKSRAASGQSGDDTMTAYNGTGMYVFNNCSVESECSTFNFGRSWADAYVVYLNTTIKSGKLVDTRFSTADMNTAPRFYGEYNTVDNSGNGKDTPESNVLKTSKGATFESVLTADQAATYTLESMFSAWDPKTIATQVEEMPKSTEGLVYLVNGEITTTCPVAGTEVRIANSRGGFGPAVTVEDNTATAISTVNASANANAPVYNITGQRVAAGTKGIVIIGGQKYVRK